MAKNKRAAQDARLADLLERVALGLESQAAESDDKKKDAKEAKNATKGLTGINNKLITGIAAWTTSLFSVQKVFGGLAQANTDLTKTLVTTSQMGNAGMEKFNRSFKDQGLGLSDSIAVFKEAAGMGMGQMSEATLRFLGGTKSLGLATGVFAQNIVTNTQALGLGEEKAVGLADTLYSTGKTYGISSDKMVAAMNGMKASLLKATVAFGPDAAKAMQVVSARMIGTLGQEFADASTKMVSDYTTGSQGMIRSMMLGVDPTQMTQGGEEGMAAGMEQISRRIVELRQQAGNDVSTPFILEAMEKQYGITTEQFNLADKMMNEHGGSLEDAVQGMVAQDVELRKQNDTMASFDETLRSLKMLVVPVLQAMAGWIEKLGPVAPFIMGGGMIAAFIGPAMIKDKRDNSRTEKVVKAVTDAGTKTANASRGGGSRLGGLGGKMGGMGAFLQQNIGKIAGVAIAGAGIAQMSKTSEMKAAPMAANIRDRETYGNTGMLDRGSVIESTNGAITKDISYNTGAHEAGTEGYDAEYEKLWEAAPDAMASREQAMLEAQVQSQQNMENMLSLLMIATPILQSMGVFSKMSAAFGKMAWVESVKANAHRAGKWAWDKMVAARTFAIAALTKAWQGASLLIQALAGATWSGGATLAVLGAIAVGAVATAVYYGTRADESAIMQEEHLKEMVDLQREKSDRDMMDNPLFTIARDMALNTAMMGEIAQMTSEANEQRTEGNEERADGNARGAEFVEEQQGV